MAEGKEGRWNMAGGGGTKLRLGGGRTEWGGNNSGGKADQVQEGCKFRVAVADKS